MPKYVELLQIVEGERGSNSLKHTKVGVRVSDINAFRAVELDEFMREHKNRDPKTNTITEIDFDNTGPSLFNIDFDTLRAILNGE